VAGEGQRAPDDGPLARMRVRFLSLTTKRPLSLRPGSCWVKENVTRAPSLSLNEKAVPTGTLGSRAITEDGEFAGGRDDRFAVTTPTAGPLIERAQRPRLLDHAPRRLDQRPPRGRRPALGDLT
jgi:hypothetical protein